MRLENTTTMQRKDLERTAEEFVLLVRKGMKEKALEFYSSAGENFWGYVKEHEEIYSWLKTAQLKGI